MVEVIGYCPEVGHGNPGTLLTNLAQIESDNIPTHAVLTNFTAGPASHFHSWMTNNSKASEKYTNTSERTRSGLAAMLFGLIHLIY